MSNIFIGTNFHRDFPFHFDQDWLVPCFAAGTGPDEHHPPSNKGEFVNVTTKTRRYQNTIYDFRHWYSSVSEDKFLKAMGTQATDYYTINSAQDADYLGSACYRRFLLMDKDNDNQKLSTPANSENYEKLTSDQMKDNALKYLKESDIVINREVAIRQTPYLLLSEYGSPESQYLVSQLKEYWFLFKEGILKANPSYASSMKWFTESKFCNFEGVYVTKKHLMRQLVTEYFLAMEHVWDNTKEVYPDKEKNSYDCTELFPWRYPGFLMERFVPFFIHANKLKKTEVPLVVLG
mgnify:FL=1